MKRSGKLPDGMTRRKFTKLAGATAISAGIPGTAWAQTAKPVADRNKALDHVVVIMFENRSWARRCRDSAGACRPSGGMNLKPGDVNHDPHAEEQSSGDEGGPNIPDHGTNRPFHSYRRVGT